MTDKELNLPPPAAPKGPFADYSAEEVEAYALEYALAVLADRAQQGEPMPSIVYNATIVRKDMRCAIEQRRAATKAAAPADAPTVAVPVEAYLWLMGLGRDGFTEDRDGAFWWRGAFNERAGLDMLDIWKASKGAAPAPDTGITKELRALIEWAYDQGGRFGDEITSEQWFYEAQESGGIAKRWPATDTGIPTAGEVEDGDVLAGYDMMGAYNDWLAKRGPLGVGAMPQRIFFAGWLASRRAPVSSNPTSGAVDDLLEAARESLRMHDEVTGGQDYGYISPKLREAVAAFDPPEAKAGEPEIRDVREFGAVGDGMTDDTAAFQRAENWAKAGEDA